MIWTPHLTVAAIVERNEKFLMVKETDDGRAVYNQPAGHVEKHETVQDAIVREVKEETAWDFLPEYIVGFYKWHKQDSDTTYVRICYAGKASNHDPEQALDDGILSANWLDFDDIMSMDSKSMRSPMVRKCISDYRNKIEYPLEFITEW